MSFKELVSKALSLPSDEAFVLYEKASYTLGFSSIRNKRHDLLDTETSIILLAILIERKDLHLFRALSPSIQWLRRYHNLLNPRKLHKMTLLAESLSLEITELPLLKLFSEILRSLNRTQFKAFEATPLSAPFYIDRRLKGLIDAKIKASGYFLDLPPSLGLMFHREAFKEKALI